MNPEERALRNYRADDAQVFGFPAFHATLATIMKMP